MSTTHTNTDELLRAVLQLPSVEWEQFITRVFTLKARERAPVLAEREAELLGQIYQGLPAATQQCLNELIEKRQAYTITETELQELSALTDQVELFDVARLERLIELAHLRNVPLQQLIQQLGLKPVPHD